MTIKEKAKVKKKVDAKVDAYFNFIKRDDYPDKPCVRRAVDMLQNSVFTLAEFLYHCKFISWEECCEYWTKVGLLEEQEKCKFTKCGANIDGFCKYTNRSDNNAE